MRNTNNKLNILVTGANGQLGLTLKELSKRFSDICFDFKTKKELDISSSQEIEEVTAIKSYNYLINCAAYTNVEEAERDPKLAYLINSEAVKKLSEICFKREICLIHISTDYVFDGEKGSPYSTLDKTNPINEYGKSKLLGEQYIQEVLHHYYIVRTSWLYSKKYGHNFYRTILKKARQGEQLRVIDNQLGCPTNTEYLSLFIMHHLIMEKADSGLYHFTDGEPMTWFEFADKILEENGLKNTTEIVRDNNYRSFANRPINSCII